MFQLNNTTSFFKTYFNLLSIPLNSTLTLLYIFLSDDVRRRRRRIWFGYFSAGCSVEYDTGETDELSIQQFETEPQFLDSITDRGYILH